MANPKIPKKSFKESKMLRSRWRWDSNPRPQIDSSNQTEFSSSSMGLQNEFIFYKDLNFRVSDSTNDFNLIVFFGFAIKSYIDSEIPRS